MINEVNSSHPLTKMTAQMDSQMPKMAVANMIISARLRSIDLFIYGPRVGGTAGRSKRFLEQSDRDFPGAVKFTVENGKKPGHISGMKRNLLLLFGAALLAAGCSSNEDPYASYREYGYTYDLVPQPVHGLNAPAVQRIYGTDTVSPVVTPWNPLGATGPGQQPNYTALSP